MLNYLSLRSATAAAVPRMLRSLSAASSTCGGATAATKVPVAAAPAANQLQQQQPPPLTAPPPAAVQFYRRVLPDNCLAFGSPEGKRVFREALEAGYMEGYFSLASQYRTQDDPSFCGLATLVMCLNSLEVDPGKVWKGPWRWFHEEMLDCCVQVDRVRQHGLTLAEFACLAGCNSLQVRRLVQPAGDADPDTDAAGFADFESVVRDCCRTDGCILVASYSRRALGQTGDGHFAPIGGYHPDRQLVLLFDTARFKYPPHWVSLRQLWDALKLPDSVTGRPRGYCVLAKARGLTAFRVSQRFATGVREPNSPLLRLARDFEDWLVGHEILTASTNRSAEAGMAESTSTNRGGALLDSDVGAFLSMAAGQLGRLCGHHRLGEAVLSRHRQNSADVGADAVLSALRLLPVHAPVGAAFNAGRLQASGDAIASIGDDEDSIALLTLLAWPLQLCCSGPSSPATPTRGALLSVARDQLMRGAPDCLSAEVQLLRNQLATIFDIAPVRASA